MSPSRLILASCVLLAACSSSDGDSNDPPPQATFPIVIQTPEFVVEPGQETTKCFYTSLPMDAEAPVARFQSEMSNGSHHLILFATDTAAQPDGTLGGCRGITPTGNNVPLPLYAAQEPQQEVRFPRGVAMPVKPRQHVVIQMHYLNPRSTPLPVSVKVTLHALAASETFMRAGTFASYQTAIDVPPRGEQTVTGSCRVPEGAKFFYLTTHSHRFTTRAEVGRNHGDTPPELLVETTDYETPQVKTFEAPYFDFAEDELHYSCAYRNDTDETVKMGDSAATDEMCMAVGYFFPATKTTLCIGSATFNL